MWPRLTIFPKLVLVRSNCFAGYYGVDKLVCGLSTSFKLVGRVFENQGK